MKTAKMLTANYWKIRVPDDIEIGRDGELFAHSPHGARFKQEASPEDIQDLLTGYARWQDAQNSKGKESL